MSLAKNQDPGKSNLQCSANDTACDSPQTKAAVLTGVGRSAIAVIGVAGTNANEVITTCFLPTTSRPFAAGQIRFGLWQGKRVLDGDLPSETASQASGESVVIAPISDQKFEIHCHGGVAATARIIDDLESLGVTVVDPRDQAWNPAVPVVIREAQGVLSRCLTARTAAIAMDQVRGAMRDWCESVLTACDTADARNDAADTKGTAWIQKDAQQMLKTADFGVRLSDRFSVVLAGPPNVGKSSLINAIVGYDRSITMDLAGTTRDVLHADTIIDGIAVRLSDTAGMRQSAGAIEHQGIVKAQQATRNADVVVWVYEAGKDDDFEQFTLLEADSAKVIRVLNKADLLSGSETLPKPETDFQTDLQTVATTGSGVPELMQAIWDAVVGTFPAAGSAVAITERQRDCLTKMAASTHMTECRKWTRQLLFGAQAE